MGLKVDKNDIDKILEEHRHELTKEVLKEFHCIPQQEVVEESLSEKVEQLPSGKNCSRHDSTPHPHRGVGVPHHYSLLVRYHGIPSGRASQPTFQPDSDRTLTR
ncbi:hypothetical protein AVEN_251722-1 [Araneus ventricosus]|uniref:Uncharacterized protein n=1 Tax=Araneus ventricosus TaxID=182803 RepID=A0A4Y2RRZ2_ARAVE|nr:hypothetical protein AVEN_251722-1 [Araneus ventricosus]